jgi:hypothetical protein
MPAPTTTEQRLANISRRIDRLDLGAGAEAGEAATRIQRRVTALRRQEACARAAVYEAAASIEQSLRRLDTTVRLAEQWAIGDVAEDRFTFAAAVTAELHDWDVYIERLQLMAGMTGGAAREQAEPLIGELRRRRNAFGEHIRDVRSASGEGWRERRKLVRAVRHELERCAARAETALERQGMT